MESDVILITDEELEEHVSECSTVILNIPKVILTIPDDSDIISITSEDEQSLTKKKRKLKSRIKQARTELKRLNKETRKEKHKKVKNASKMKEIQNSIQQSDSDTEVTFVNESIIIPDETLKTKTNGLQSAKNDEETPKKQKRKLISESDETKSIDIQPSTSGQQLFQTEKDSPEKKKIKLSSSNSESEKTKTNTKLSTTRQKTTKNESPKKKKISSKNSKTIKKSLLPTTHLNLTTLRNTNQIKFECFEEDLLAEKQKLQKHVARSMIKLFEEGNTIPFIARYRRHLTGDMTPDELRNLRESYDEVLELKSKSVAAIKTLTKSGKLSEELEHIIVTCKSLEELEHVYAPYKDANKKTLAERARKLGLEDSALAILNNNEKINIESLIQENGPKGLRNINEVEKNLIHILGDIISHHPDVVEFLRDMKENVKCRIVTKLTSAAKKTMNDENVMKFNTYYDNSFSVDAIKPYQILAINRGESLKILNVKVDIPGYAFYRFKQFCENKWLYNPGMHGDKVRLIQETVKEIYDKHVTPLLTRKIRSDLKTFAHKAAVVVFAKNLKRLLLEPTIKGKVIMGIDPGFKVGCKLAVISQLGDVLHTGVIYPHSNYSVDAAENVKNLLQTHSCSLIAIGNGKAGRETESWLTNLIKNQFFTPLDVSYTIVDESGASVYSCSDEAKKEFPDLDPLEISAISLARRIQNPLAELVKIDPKSLGVGMYQHDLNQTLLDAALSEVVSECVSFVGVDLNTASHCLLRRVAGLTSKRAESVIKYRQTHGPFTNRYQIKDVYGVGEKTFEQCSGFLRIIPSNSSEAAKFYKRPETSPLDATDIHPEAYGVTEKLLQKFGLFYKHVGLPDFIKQFKSKINLVSIEKIADEFNSTQQTIQLIIDALSKPLDYDLRTENREGPLFKTEITTMEDLKPDLKLTGRVTNVVSFGAFVDVGVERSGLIHNTNMKGIELLLGHRVRVTVLSVDQRAGRIDLKLDDILV